MSKATQEPPFKEGNGADCREVTERKNERRIKMQQGNPQTTVKKENGVDCGEVAASVYI